MRLISYSLFKAPCEQFERLTYIRGLYFNVRMNNMIFPDWITHLEVEQSTYDEYSTLFNWLCDYARLRASVNPDGVSLCGGMIRRIKPIFYQDVSHVLCRDADSITTYREALAVQQWLESRKKVHCIIDNRAHTGMMGGMVGFDGSWLKGCMETSTWEGLIKEWDFTQRGSDQNWMNAKVYPRVKDDIYWSGGPLGVKIPDMYSSEPLPQVEKRLWESNLVSAFIGAAGFNELELLRFFKNNDTENYKYVEIEKQYPNLFWWRA